MSKQVLTDFISRPKSYALLNSTPDKEKIRVHGRTMVIPAMNVVGSNPALDSAGNPIPGSAVFTDSSSGDGELIWEAAMAIRCALGIDPYSGQAIGDYARKGVSLITDFSPEGVQAIREAGRRRWDEWQMEVNKQIVEAYESKIFNMQKVGLTPPAPPEEYHRAKAAVNLLRKEYTPGDPTENATADPDFIIFAKQKAKEISEKAVRAEQQEGLAEAMVNDPEFLKLVAKKHKELLRRG